MSYLFMLRIMVIMLYLLAIPARGADLPELSLNVGLDISQSEESLAAALYQQITGNPPGKGSESSPVESRFTGGITKGIGGDQNQNMTQNRNFVEVSIPIKTLTLNSAHYPLVLSFYNKQVTLGFKNGVGKFLDPLKIKLVDRSVAISTVWTYTPSMLDFLTLSISPRINYTQSSIRASSALIDSKISTEGIWPSVRTSLGIKPLDSLPLRMELRSDLAENGNQSVGAGLSITIPLD